LGGMIQLLEIFGQPAIDAIQSSHQR